MKNFLALLFSCCILPAWCQMAPIEFENLNGKIKSIEETYSYVSNNFTVSRFIFHNTFEFNKNSKLTSWKRYNEDGTSRSEEVFEYDRKNQRKLHQYEYDSNKNLKAHHVYDYDVHGNLIRIWNVLDKEGNNKILIISYGYDENGNQTSDTAYGFSGDIMSSSTRTYNDQGYVVSSTLTSFGKTTTNKPTRDTHGHLLELKRFNSAGILTDHWMYENDEYGNEISLKAFNPDGTLKYTNRTEYEYDSAKNWIKRTEFGHVDTSVTERIIHYYN